MNTATDYRETGERTADECDFASNISMAETERHLKRKQQEIASIALDPDFDGVHCVECGEKIPPARIKSLLLNIPDDGRTRVPIHSTNRHCKQNGVPCVKKHGTDKCVTCQSEFNRASQIRGRQNAF